MRSARSLLKLPAALGLVVALGFGFFDGADQVWLLMLAVSGVLLALLLWPRRAPGQPVFSRTVQRLATLLLIGFILTSVQLVRQQVILALGSRAEGWLADGNPDLVVDAAGLPAVDDDGSTSLGRVYAGGDLIRGSATVVEALGDGMRAAEAIDRALTRA